MIIELLSRFFILNLLFPYFPFDKLFPTLTLQLQGNTEGLCGIFSRKRGARANLYRVLLAPEDRGLGQV